VQFHQVNANLIMIKCGQFALNWIAQSREICDGKVLTLCYSAGRRVLVNSSPLGTLSASGGDEWTRSGWRMKKKKKKEEGGRPYSQIDGTYQHTRPLTPPPALLNRWHIWQMSQLVAFLLVWCILAGVADSTPFHLETAWTMPMRCLG